MNPDDDLFSRLFELFNQPGPVNWKLASEVSHHLTGERVPVEPWAAEEYRELARLAEFRVEDSGVATVATASDVLPLDSREWADRHLEAFGYLAEPFSDLGGVGVGTMAQLAPAMIGMQVGSLVGGLATWVLAGFDGGLPVDRPLPLSFLVPNIEAFAVRHSLDPKPVRLWVVSEEVAYRAVSAVPFTTEHLRRLLEAEAATIEFDPSALSGLIGMTDPSQIQAAVQGEMAGLFDDEATLAARSETEAYLGLIAGYARLAASRSVAELLPDLDCMVELRDAERQAGTAAVPFGPTSPSSPSIRAGLAFCLEVERRYGRHELLKLWKEPDRIPAAAELSDPVAWAARVLLDDF